MTAGEKITERILLDAGAAADEIAAEAEKKAGELFAKADAEAKAAGAELKLASDKKAVRVAESAKSASALIVRNALLKCRRDEIDRTITATEEYLLNLPADEYFAVLLKMIDKNACKDGGVLVLNSKDLKRLPDSFADGCKKLGITLSKTPDDSIGGGFILKYGDIEIDGSFASVIAEKREQLEDIINKQLF